MLKFNCFLILITLLTAPIAWGGFHVHTGNLKVFEDDSAIRYGAHGISNKQCLRSRNGRVDSKWPCVYDRRYVPGDVRNNRLYIYTTPYEDKLYSPGFRRLIATKP